MSDKNDYLEHYEDGIKIKEEFQIDCKGLNFAESYSEVLFILFSLQVWTFPHPS